MKCFSASFILPTKVEKRLTFSHWRFKWQHDREYLNTRSIICWNQCNNKCMFFMKSIWFAICFCFFSTVKLKLKNNSNLLKKCHWGYINSSIIYSPAVSIFFYIYSIIDCTKTWTLEVLLVHQSEMLAQRNLESFIVST